MMIGKDGIIEKVTKEFVGAVLDRNDIIQALETARNPRDNHISTVPEKWRWLAWDLLFLYMHGNKAAGAACYSYIRGWIDGMRDAENKNY